MPLTADEILRRSAEVYANCSSYRDEGVVTNVHVSGPRSFERRTRRQPFRTLFTRPALWRFEYWNEDIGPREEWSHRAIWTDQRGHHAWWTARPDDMETETIGLLIAGATGVSSGAAHTIPCLLDPSLGGRDPLTFDDAIVEAEEIVLGHPCYRVKGRQRNRESDTLWIQCDTFLIRRVFGRTVFDAATRSRLDKAMSKHNEWRRETGRPVPPEDHTSRTNARDFTSETTTDYHPAINTLIDPSEFHFTPPT